MTELSSDNPKSRPAAVAAVFQSQSQHKDERLTQSSRSHDNVPETTLASWDDEGVFVYQAYNDEIADFTVKNQRLGGAKFNPQRMTWIKPSFAWVLYRSGYAKKDKNQARILKLKLKHEDFARLVSLCTFGHDNGGGDGRIQWDPERDMMAAEWNQKHRCWYPRRCEVTRAIQIGLKGVLSEEYVKCVVGVEDVTELAHAVGAAHASGRGGGKRDSGQGDRERRERDVDEKLQALLKDLPNEKQYPVNTPVATEGTQE